MPDKKTVIFDFDGTIADTLLAMFDIVNRLSNTFGYNKISRDKIPILQEKRPKEILKHLGISMLKLPKVVKKIRSELNNEIINLKPSIDIRTTLLQLKENNCRIGILTTNSKDNVTKFLKKNELDLFDFVYSGQSVFGKGHLLKKLLKIKEIDQNSVFYVADEVRDIQAAKKSKIKVIAVSWGFNTKTALKREKPNFFVEKPDELIDIIIKNNTNTTKIT